MEQKTPVQVEKELQALLDKHRLSDKLSVGQIKQWILSERNEESDSPVSASNAFQKRCMKYFSRVKSHDEFFVVTQALINAWNYFPHQSLGGKSPWQMVQKEMNKHPELKRKSRSHEMPVVVVGGHTMKWKEYEAMLREMERVQAPFKHWIEHETLPEYRRHLSSKVAERIAKKHIYVAELFFDRVLHVGFVTLDTIRPDFIQKEFPRWWQTHVMMSSLTEKEVLSSLKNLFLFIGSLHNNDIGRFGF
ncbi:MAG: hypothetical protein A2945_04860 [Candidatus Liptonbacteria bacterium RIFCSPLOWO2_01_FULL_52_25]|uniref:Uncharacterized protein n=1 Tax=Candidatus Liptonbacteria bacterium RIFCSPLOWO2_01_FULL_52_25 TaxID=1798650 RepID=A0A1G2CD25_9BACT|nr:MAG: hypothetical protein A2945_04860 [Candidatus Liptonbacteria bacterium RIFCSPLOWO2_01_FULL_52_25]